MPTSLIELYVNPNFQTKLKAAIEAKIREQGETPPPLEAVVIVKDNVGRIEGTTSITATFTSSGYSGELAITTEEVWQDYPVEELADQSEVEILELEKL